MAKTSGGTRSGGSSNPKGVGIPQRAASVAGLGNLYGAGTRPGATKADIEKEINYLRSGMNEPMVLNNPQMRIQMAQRIDILNNRLRSELLGESSSKKMVVWKNDGSNNPSLRNVGEMPLRGTETARFQSNGKTYQVTHVVARPGVAAHFDVDGIGNSYHHVEYYGAVTPQGEGISQGSAWQRTRNSLSRL